MSNMKATWQPYDAHGGPAARSNLPDSVFAFPTQRKATRNM